MTVCLHRKGLDAVSELKRQYPEFSKLLEERVSFYNKNTEARIPLDFASELLPAAASAANKVGMEEGSNGSRAPSDEEDPFAESSGLFRKKRSRIRSFPHVLGIDEMDCGAASLAMICRHFGRKVSLFC